MEFTISAGIMHTAQKVVLYGPEGIGKSTFAAQFPDPLFIDTEGSTKLLDVRRLDTPSSWEMLIEEVKFVKAHPNLCKTLVIDTADWAEKMLLDSICAQYKVKSIEDFGYGKGYTFVYEGFGKLLNALEDLICAGINVCVTAHATMRKFEQPDEMGAYDRWEMKLSKKVAPMLKEWADMVLFANYQTFVVKQDNKMLHDKVQGGKRVVYTSHNPCWDAKNRHGLPEQIDFSFSAIAHLIPAEGAQATAAGAQQDTFREVVEPSPVESLKQKIEDFNADEEAPAPAAAPEQLSPGIPKALADLMTASGVSEKELQHFVFQNGYYPESVPIADYDPDFINGWIIQYWEQIKGTIGVPF